MVAGVHFYASVDDSYELMDYLDVGTSAALHPWPLARSPLSVISRDEALRSRQVTVTCVAFGPPVVIRDGDQAMNGLSRAALFDRINMKRLSPGMSQGLVDSNASPVLVWQTAVNTQGELRTAEIGSQADSMRHVSEDYAKWVKRVMSWVTRRGTPVWRLGQSAVRPDLDIMMGPVSTVYALPGALRLLEEGWRGRQ